MARLRFFAQAAPSWWPYQLVSLANERLPPRVEPEFYHILADNGLWLFYKEGRRPGLDHWLRKLWVFAGELQRLRRPRELWIILPDWLADFEFTYEAAAHPLARRLCRNYRCMAVVHAASPPLWAPGGAYGRLAEALASLDHIAGLAAPLKLPCLRYDERGRRRIVDGRGLRCQLSIVEQVCRVARSKGLRCHGLGMVLEPGHIRRAGELGLGSFDSTAWTRPNKSLLRKYLGAEGLGEMGEQIEKGEVSAKTAAQKELFLWLKVRHLADSGAPIEIPGGFPEEPPARAVRAGAR